MASWFASDPSSVRAAGTPELVCFSHLRWNFVWQRPQHLLSRFARRMPVYVVEEPEVAGTHPRLAIAEEGGVTVVTPRLPDGPDGFGPETNAAVRALITPLFAKLTAGRARPIFWYYTPMAYGAEPAGVDPAL